MKHSKGLSLILVLCLVFGLLPVMATAADTQEIYLHTDGIADGEYVDYGGNRWLVLDAQADNTGAQDGIFLLSEQTLGSVSFDADGLCNVWAESDARAWAATYAADTFTAEELTAIKAVTKTDAAGTYGDLNWDAGSLTGEQVFFLSAAELDACPTDALATGSGWWLRSGHTENGEGIYAGLVSDLGFVGTPHVAATYSARPAMNLDTEKITVATKVDAQSWKVSVLDESSSFTASVDVQDPQVGYTDWNAGVTYTGAYTGADAYVRVMLCDPDGKAVYTKDTVPENESGTVSVTLPEGLTGAYTLCVFAGRKGEDAHADVTSAPVQVPLKVKEQLGQIVDWSLTLGADLTLKFYVSVAESVAADASMTVRVGNQTSVQKVADAPKDENGYYIFTAEVAAAQMTEAVSLQLSAGEISDAVHTYSVRQYADAILADAAQANCHALVREMLHYGAKAQLYFNYRTDDLANAGITVDAVQVPAAAPTSAGIRGSLPGITFYGAAMVFDAKTAVRYYFQVTGNIQDYTFTVGDDTYTATQKDGYYYVEVSGINPQALGDAVVIQVSDGTGTMQLSYSPMHYIVRMYNGNGTDALKDLLQAMYGYHLAAAEYVSNI